MFLYLLEGLTNEQTTHNLVNEKRKVIEVGKATLKRLLTKAFLIASISSYPHTSYCRLECLASLYVDMCNNIEARH